MTAKKFEDLIAWQLAAQLEDAVFEMTSRGPAARDFGFRDQIRDSARSAPRNIAEGFGRYYPKEFCRFLRIAAGSLHETKNHIQHGTRQKYWSEEQGTTAIRLTLRAIKGNARLQHYLSTAAAPVPYAPPKNRNLPDAG